MLPGNAGFDYAKLSDIDAEFRRSSTVEEKGFYTLLRAELKVEADVEPPHITIVEVRPPWDGRGEHTRFPIARLRYTAATGLWSLYWRDRNLKFHEYDRKRPNKNVQVLLDYLDSHADPIFWG